MALIRFPTAIALLFAAAPACGGDGDPGGGPTEPDGGPFNPVAPATQPRGPATPAKLTTLSQGAITDRLTTDLWTHGSFAYTATFGVLEAGAPLGNKIFVWDISGPTVVKVDSVAVEGIVGFGDIQVSDDGRFLVAATEFNPGSIVVFDLADPRRPVFLSRFSNADTDPGVHTATLARVNGNLYAFLAIDAPSKLVIVDLSNPAQPTQVYAATMGDPFVHDVFVRDGVLFTALWDQGLGIWDVGGAGRGGSPSNPVRLSTVQTVNGNVHNVWWYHDAVNGSKQYVFVGEESNPFSTGVTSRGDVHVVDVRDMSTPREVARFHVEGAGAHNFSVDERAGVLYVAFYNGGVRALDVRGRLDECDAAGRLPDGRCDLTLSNRLLATGLTDVGRVFVWGVHYDGTALYASDMLNGLWKLQPVNLGP